mmetsp:Transcript_14301/g.30553  ORF Transcript_14301/g.30553 Transcript_14301/m.30553 type:complete len:118 (-) Transcript_14301:167-520(-)
MTRNKCTDVTAKQIRLTSPVKFLPRKVAHHNSSQLMNGWKEVTFIVKYRNGKLQTLQALDADSRSKLGQACKVLEIRANNILSTKLSSDETKSMAVESSEYVNSIADILLVQAESNV